MRTAATSRCRDNLTARITAFTLENVNGIFPPAFRVTLQTIFLPRGDTRGPHSGFSPHTAELTQICDISRGVAGVLQIDGRGTPKRGWRGNRPEKWCRDTGARQLLTRWSVLCILKSEHDPVAQLVE